MNQIISANVSRMIQANALRTAFLMADPKQRLARATEKRTLILKLLRDEIWTVTEVIASLLNIKYAAAHAVLKAMQRDGLITSKRAFIPSDRGVKLVVLHGITAKGLAFSWDLNEVPEYRNPWEASKTNPLFVNHQIETQLARIKAEKLGWRDWLPARSLMNKGIAKLPDGQVTNLAGECIAVEIEREIKTDRRYECVIGAYIYEIKNKRWDRVDYICPDSDFAARLARNFGRLKKLRLESSGNEPAITGKLEQAHLNLFRFYATENWPDGDYITAKKSAT